MRLSCHMLLLLLFSVINHGTDIAGIGKEPVYEDSVLTPAAIPDFTHWERTTPRGKISRQDSTRYLGRKNLRISHKLFDGSNVHHLDIDDCDTVTIEYCAFKNAKGRAVDLYNCNVVRFRNCYFEDNVSGFYANKCTKVIVYKNQFKNMLGPPIEGVAIQFNNVSGSGNSIKCNYIVNLQGQSNPQDNINIYKSRGAKSSPIIVDSNYVWGGGPSKSGGGILLGDGGGRYQRARNNVCVYPGQYGIGNTSGSDCEISNNIVYQTQKEWTNVGIVCYDYYRLGCNNNVVRNNRVYYVNKLGKSTPYYIPDPPEGCSGTATIGNKWEDKTLNDRWEPPANSKPKYKKLPKK
jgi:endo-chitodextinase